VTAVAISLSPCPRFDLRVYRPNGSGKTTTIAHDREHLLSIAARSASLGWPARTSTDLIGYLPKSAAFTRKMTVQALLEFYGELRSGRSVRPESRAGSRGSTRSRASDKD